MRIFDVDPPEGHEARVTAAVAGELNARRSSRRHWILGLLGGAGGLIAAVFAGYFVRRGADAAAEPELLLTVEMSEIDVDPELFAEVPLEDIDEFLQDLDLLETEENA